MAYPVEKGPTDHVRNLLESISDVLEDRVDPKEEGQSGKAGAIKNLIVANFDQVEMARGALGAKWDELTDQKRDEFLSLFKALFLESYTKLVLNFLRREELEITGESEVDGRKMVLTRIRRRDDVIPVSYYLQKEDERWLIVEVDIDGVGIVRNYNRSFGNVIRKASFDDLIERMRIQERALKKGSESD
ncbi:MAG: ABC transporter substrate-binding protein [Deltaproteobacteria bacterium]|nr:ABC transporter substrate-binding protein [Deltaproteobacteria bacterium]